MGESKEYIYFDATISLCVECHKKIEAKIIFENDNVYMIKTCKEHGFQKVLIADDVEYYKRIRNYNRKSDYPKVPHTEVRYGCPYDCGLCADHEQHSCLALIEVTDRCNLTCPTCYASSSPTHGRHRTLEEIRFMVEAVVASEGEPDIIQISGGEPTIHPQFFEIVDLVREYPVKHLMINTNGIRIADDFTFAEKLASYQPDFELYLQFDSLKSENLMQLRGRDLLEIRMKTLEHLNKLNLSTTLVITLQKGFNDSEIGELIEFALKQKCVRGITFQPVQVAGRLTQFDASKDRLTNTEVRSAILAQTDIFTPEDLIPVPCNPDALIMGYALKQKDKVVPLTNLIDPELLLNSGTNTIVFEQNEELQKHVIEMFSASKSTNKAEQVFNQLLCCLPKVLAPKISYDNLFRIIIMNFMDAYDFDIRAIKKSCVHIVHTDGRIIPFETMNMFYRDSFREKLETFQVKG